MPGRPLWKNFRSKVLPRRGLSSTWRGQWTCSVGKRFEDFTPAQKSNKGEPATYQPAY